MQKWLQPQLIFLLFVMVRSGHLAIAAIMAKDTLWAVLYIIIAILALLSAALILFGV